MPRHTSSSGRPTTTRRRSPLLVSTYALALLSIPSTTLARASTSSFATSSAAPSTLDALISQYGLNQTFTFPQPDGELNSTGAVSYLKDEWSLNRHQVQTGQEYMSFVADPFDNTDTNATVLEIDYTKGSYGGDGKGGAQFYAQPLNGSSQPLSTMLLRYDVAFSDDFNFSQGGKLPGVRGGPDPKNCSGGNEADGLDCFSMRLMWRSGGAGEVYAYIPTSGYSLCSSSDVICNSDYGTSLSRGSFVLPAGEWTSLALFVQLNDPPTVANGRVFLYANDVLALAHDNLQLRAADAIGSIGGLFFSTFFGGADVSWASPRNQSTFYRNFELLGGTGVSDGSGSTVSAGVRAAALAPAAVALGAALGLTALSFL